MYFPFFIAKRYIRSRKRSGLISLIAVISITGISLGVSALIITLSVLNGFEKAVSEKIINFNSHIQISGFSGRNLDDYVEMRPALLTKLSPYASGISPFASKLAIIKAKDRTEGITVKGILPEYDVSRLKNSVIEGVFDISYNDTLPSLFIGRKLADKLFIKCGDRVTVFSLMNDKPPAEDNPPSIRKFNITGIYESGMAEYDDLYAYTNLTNARQIFGMGSLISGYDIRVNDITKIDSLTANLNSYLRYPYYSQSIFTMFQAIFTWIDLQKKPIPIILGLIVVVAAFNIIGTLLMVVLERTSAIGILKSLGAKNSQITTIFLIQGYYLAFIGIIVGNLVAFLLSYIQMRFGIITLPDTIYYLSKAPISIDWRNYALVSGITFVLCALTSYLPSYIASRISPLTSLRFD